MPCGLSANISLGCPLPIAGITKFNIIAFDSVTALTEASTGITGATLASGKSFYTWTTEPDNIHASTTRNSHRENGSKDSYTQKVGIKIPGLSETISSEIEKAGEIRCIIVTKTANGEWFMWGRKRGLVMKKDEASTGQKLGDFQGYDIEFEGQETHREIAVAAGGLTALGLS